MFFDTWHGLLRVIVVGVLAYAAVVAILRISGKRTLAKMNAFDLVVTVALGSTLATIILSKGVALLEGLLALALLALLQFVIAWSSAALEVGGERRQVPASYPVARWRDRRLRIAGRAGDARGTARCRARWGGFGGLDAIAAVVLETDGSFSVISRTHAASGSALP